MNLSNSDKDTIWTPFTTTKGANLLKGYIAEHYYLALDNETIPCISEEDTARDKIEEIISKVDVFIERTDNLKEKQRELNGRETVLNKKEELLNTKERTLNYAKYCYEMTFVK